MRLNSPCAGTSVDLGFSTAPPSSGFQSSFVAPPLQNWISCPKAIIPRSSFSNSMCRNGVVCQEKRLQKDSKNKHIVLIYTSIIYKYLFFRRLPLFFLFCLRLVRKLLRSGFRGSHLN